MKLASWEIQKAVVNHLKEVLSVPIFDGEAPSLTKFPYVVLGETTSASWRTKQSPGTQETITIHVWTDRGGNKQCKGMMSQISEGLTSRARLELEGFFVSGIRLELAETLKDPDGYRHGVLRFRFLIHERKG
ncbi:Protein of unknown function [Marininema mesophilum]|uniref:DUF3168 domain-containing protein n=1 Tax=Marininema mesophilum TaxID=1048340 RepID=A0A1H3BTJ9_9BACL|nr:DUF3168 domain-containing protein [Marininema mesophilum]SDX45071.1 Protein of unknown function [Marininema mesophilum]